MQDPLRFFPGFLMPAEVDFEESGFLSGSVVIFFFFLSHLLDGSGNHFRDSLEIPFEV